VAIDDFSLSLANPAAPGCPTLVLPIQQASDNPPTISWTRNAADDPVLPLSYDIYFNEGMTASTRVTNVKYSVTSVLGPVTLPSATYTVKVVPLGYNNAQPTGCASSTFKSVAQDVMKSLPYFENFEAGVGGWNATGTINTWGFGTPKKTTIQGAASGINAWVTGGLGNGTYASNELSFLNSPVFDFTKETNDPILSFKIWWDSEDGFDGAILQYANVNGWQSLGSSTDGAWYNMANIVSMSNFLAVDQTSGWSGQNATSSFGYVKVSHTLVGTAGHAVKLRIVFSADGGIEFDGVAVDDVTIASTSPPGGTLVSSALSLKTRLVLLHFCAMLVLFCV